MPLNDISLDELTHLTTTLSALRYAGKELREGGLEPRFDLTPGEEMVITVSARMPDLDAVIEDLFSAPPPAAADQTAPLVADATAELVAEICKPSAATPETAGSPPLADPEGAAESGGGLADPATQPEPPAAAVPPAPVSDVSAAADTNERALTGVVWTEEEDARLVTLVVGAMVGLSLGKTAAIRAAAKELGRPEAGTGFRAHHKLKARIDAALAEAQEAAKAMAAYSGADPAPQPAPEAAAAPEAPAAPVAAAWTDHAVDPLTAHLMAQPDKGGWTLARDLDLMELSCAGWMPQEISVELKVSAKEVKARFDALTGLHTDAATDKQARRWTREAVVDALQELQRRNAKAGAA